jgi:hypothetical protein
MEKGTVGATFDSSGVFVYGADENMKANMESVLRSNFPSVHLEEYSSCMPNLIFIHHLSGKQKYVCMAILETLIRSGCLPADFGPVVVSFMAPKPSNPCQWLYSETGDLHFNNFLEILLGNLASSNSDNNAEKKKPCLESAAILLLGTAMFTVSSLTFMNYILH